MAKRRAEAKADILRGLYEDNLGIARSLPHSVPEGDPSPAWGTRVFVLAAFLAAIFGGTGPYSAPTGPVTVLSPDEQIMQQFGTAYDPGRLPPVEAALPLASIYGLGVKTIVIDPGHGGHDPGAVGPTGLTEKTVVLDVALRLERRLKAHGFDVHLTRSTDTSMTLKARVGFAVDAKADMLLSIHVNALETSPGPVVETFYFNPRGTATTERLAKRENFNSGFTIAEWRSRLRALASTLKQEESQRLAESVQATLYEGVRAFDPAVKDWGTKGGPFSVLSDRWRNAGSPEELSIPAALTEISVINYAHGEALLKSDEYREGIAAALFEGIAAFALPAGTEVVDASRKATAASRRSYAGRGLPSSR